MTDTIGKDKEWHVIGRGFAGWHAAGLGVSSSGGHLDPYTYWTGKACAGYRQEAIEGALVYDASALEGTPALADAFVHFVISGPLLDLRLEPDQVQRLTDRLGMPAPPTEEQATSTDAPRAFDFVGVGVFERMLRAVPGVRIGRVQKGEVQWET